MRKIILIISVLMSVGILFPQCDKIEEPYLENPNPDPNPDPDPDPDPDPTTPQVRNVLLFDFTGHQCGNCPEGHRTIKQIQTAFGDKFIPIAIHSTYFARFSEGASKYFYNFTCPEGIELGGDVSGGSGHFPIIALPQGVVNSFASDQVINQGDWAPKVGSYSGQTATFNVEITSELTDSDGKSNIEIDVVSQQDTILDLMVGAYILESDIVNWQLDYSVDPQDIESYVHDHVLRGSYNGTFGEQLNTSNTITKNQRFEKSYSLDLGADWVADNCVVIAFVYDSVTKEILQASEVHLK